MSFEAAREISVIIPVYNERENLPALFEEIESLEKSLRASFEVIAVDDYSTDGSREYLEEIANRLEFLRVVPASENMGMGGAIMHGASQSRGRFLFWAMADLSDRLSDIAAIYDKLREGNDLVIASRAMPQGSYGGLLGWKSFLSHSYSRIASRWFGIPVHDVTNAFRGMRRELFFALNLKYRDFTLSPEMTIKAHRSGARVGETPTIYRYRQAGVSSFKVLKMGIEYASLLALRFSPMAKLPGDLK